jgi:hypothetical protein
MSLNIKALRAAITKSNKRFASMTPAQKRVRIAKDVIAQLDAKEIVAKNGVYFSLAGAKPYDSVDSICDENAGASVQELARTEFLGCNVCAIGAGFIASVKRLNKLKVEDLLTNSERNIDDDDMVAYLIATGAFTETQARKLELVFERHGGYFDWQAGKHMAGKHMAGYTEFTADLVNGDVLKSDAIMRRVWGFIIQSKGKLNFPRDKRI